MAFAEINFDGIIGPSHNYAGLSLGNIASANNAGAVSEPRAAALQGVEKMRANLRLGLPQGFFMPLDRPNTAWLAGSRNRYGKRRAAHPRRRFFRIGHVGRECCDGIACARYAGRQMPSVGGEPADHGTPQP